MDKKSRRNESLGDLSHVCVQAITPDRDYGFRCSFPVILTNVREHTHTCALVMTHFNPEVTDDVFS